MAAPIRCGARRGPRPVRHRVPLPRPRTAGGRGLRGASSSAGTAGRWTPPTSTPCPAWCTCWSSSLRSMLPPGTPLVLPTPTYMPFLTLPAELGVDLRLVPMNLDDGRYTMDLPALRAALTTDVPDTGALLVLINPHNPTGRVFACEELLALADVVEQSRRDGVQRRDPRPAGVFRAPARAVRLAVAGDRRAHPDRRLGVQGLEPSRPQLRPADPVRRPAPGAVGRGLVLGGGGHLPARRDRLRGRLSGRCPAPGRDAGLSGREPSAVRR